MGRLRSGRIPNGRPRIEMSSQRRRTRRSRTRERLTRSSERPSCRGMIERARSPGLITQDCLTWHTSCRGANTRIDGRGLLNVLPLSKIHHAAFDRELYTINSGYRLQVNPGLKVRATSSNGQL